MDENTKLQEGDIVQLTPELGNPMLAACFMVVTEVKNWGAQGYIQCTGSNGEMGGLAYYRAKWDDMELTGGRAEWRSA